MQWNAPLLWRRDALDSPNAFDLVRCQGWPPEADRSLRSEPHLNRTPGPLMISAMKGVRRANLSLTNVPRCPKCRKHH